MIEATVTSVDFSASLSYDYYSNHLWCRQVLHHPSQGHCLLSSEQQTGTGCQGGSRSAQNSATAIRQLYPVHNTLSHKTHCHWCKQLTLIKHRGRTVPTLQHTEKALIGLLLLAHAPIPEVRRAIINSLYSFRWMVDIRMRNTCSSFIGNVVLSTAWLRLQNVQSKEALKLACH